MKLSDDLVYVDLSNNPSLTSANKFKNNCVQFAKVLHHLSFFSRAQPTVSELRDVLK